MTMPNQIEQLLNKLLIIVCCIRNFFAFCQKYIRVQVPIEWVGSKDLEELIKDNKRREEIFTVHYSWSTVLQQLG